MSNHVYKKVEIVGSSKISIDDAVQTAINKAAKSIRNIRWFEVDQIRGEVEDGKVAHFQVTLNLGFKLED